MIRYLKGNIWVMVRIKVMASAEKLDQVLKDGSEYES